jgi:hypothetical protein
MNHSLPWSVATGQNEGLFSKEGEEIGKQLKVSTTTFSAHLPWPWLYQA